MSPPASEISVSPCNARTKRQSSTTHRVIRAVVGPLVTLLEVAVDDGVFQHREEHGLERHLRGRVVARVGAVLCRPVDPFCGGGEDTLLCGGEGNEGCHDGQHAWEYHNGYIRGVCEVGFGGRGDCWMTNCGGVGVI